MPNDDFRGYLKRLVIHCPSSASKGTNMCRFYGEVSRKSTISITRTTLLAKFLTAHVE